MELKHDKLNNFHIIEVSGRLDVNSAEEFENRVGETINAGNIQLVIDMSGVEYVSSAGLRCILLAAKTIKAESGELRFSGLSGLVEEVFAISGFKSMFKIYDTIALAAE